MNQYIEDYTKKMMMMKNDFGVLLLFIYYAVLSNIFKTMFGLVHTCFVRHVTV